MVGAPFHPVVVNVPNLGGAVLSPPVTAVLIRLNVVALAAGLLLLRHFVSSLRVLFATDVYSESLFFYHGSPGPASQRRSCRNLLRYAAPLGLRAGAEVLPWWV